MRRLECARPARTATGQARNAGEAVQQLAHIARERQRLGQERKAIVRRMHKIDARLEAMTTLEDKLMPMMRQDAERAKAAALPTPTPAPAPAPTPAPPPPPRRRSVLPIGLSQVTLHY